MFTGSTYNPNNPSAPMSMYGYVKPKPPVVVSYHGPQMEHIKTGIQGDKDKINPKDIFKEKKRKPKNEEIEGNTIPEITNNIIAAKPNLKILRKAFKKMIEIVEEEQEANLFF